jgi:ATP adenylyltransferase/5',5'''-P-1,P-4-tetraphosphate phosphorylase II
MPVLENVIVDEKKLSGSDLAERVRSFFKYQLETWDFAAAGYESLNSVLVKDFEFDDYIIKVQFNPGRITSTSAKVDRESIKARKCFLCYDHLPAEQKGIPYYRDYLILVNPFPIFPEHITIPKIDHVPQYIEGNMEGMLNLTRDIGKYYTVFYNGPKCGASAPDHMHFQAGLRNFMPIETEIDVLLKKGSSRLIHNDDVKIHGVGEYLGKFFHLESHDKKKIFEWFLKLYTVFQKLNRVRDEEPMMNILSNYRDKKWRLLIFPRMNHRPDYFFKEGASQLLISPAAVDFGGVVITPREEDFNKITKDIVIKIFRQVSISTEMFEYYKKEILAELNSEE